MRRAVSLLPLALLLSACDNPIRPNLGQTPNDAASAAVVTTDLTGVRVMLTYTELGSPPLPPSTTGAAYWIEGTLSKHASPGVNLGRIEDEKTVYGIALGTYDIAVSYGPSTYPLRLPGNLSVSVRANQTTPVSVELNKVLGVIAGTLTLNQAPPGDGLVLCTYTGTGAPKTVSQLLWCTPLAADGSFRQLLPSVDGQGRPVPAADGHGLVCSATTVNGQGCPNPIASFPYRVEAGRTIVLPPLNVGTAGVKVVLTYADRDLGLPPLPPSATGAAYWIEGALRMGTCNTAGACVKLGRIEDEKAVYGIPLGTYDVALSYGPYTYPLSLPRRVSVQVRANQTTPVTVELGEVLGVIAGAVTLNQAPPGDGFALCMYSTSTRELLWCTPLAADGGFRQLLPDGDGYGRVCSATAVNAQGCPNPIASFTYRVQAGHTVVLPPMNVGGAATQLAFTVQPSTTAAEATISPAVRVTARDAFGNTFTGFRGTVTVGLGGPGKVLAKLGGTTTIAAVAGVATFSDLFIHGPANAYTLSATAEGLTMATSAPFDVVAGSATQLEFTVQPSTTTAGATMAPAVQVTARDGSGNPSTGFGGTVTLECFDCGTLGGTTTMPAGAGVATFSDLHIDRAGTGYTLSATAVGLTMATSNSFDIVAGPATQLAFTVQPSTATVGATISPAIQVTAQDAFGNTATGFGGEVAVGPASKKELFKLGGTGTMAAVAGVAIFSDLVIGGAAGGGYTLSATAEGLTMATSAPFDIVAGAPTWLEFTVQPSTTTAGATISPAVQVTARDASGNTSSDFGGTVTLECFDCGTLSGSLTKAIVAGVATFSDLSIDRAGTGYTLSATAAGLTMATSTPFDITVPP